MPESNQFLALLDSRKEELKTILPSYLDLERFVSNARTVLNDRQLYDAQTRKFEVTIDSLFGCVIDAARRGLEIGGPNKHCAVVKFKQTAILIVQWQGKAFLWSKCGATKKLTADVVYVGDTFTIERGDDDKIVHIPDIETHHDPKWLNDAKNMRGAYAIATLWNGEKVRSFVSRSQMERLMEWVKDKNGGKLSFGYRDWLPEMFRKTAVHRLEGFIQPPPNMSAEQIDILNRAMAPDTSFDAETDGVEVLPPVEVDETPKGRKEPKQVGGGKLVLKPEPKPPEQDRMLTQDEMDEVFEAVAKAGMKFAQLRPIIFQVCGKDDLAAVMLSQKAKLEQAIDSAAIARDLQDAGDQQGG